MVRSCKKNVTFVTTKNKQNQQTKPTHIVICTYCINNLVSGLQIEQVMTHVNRSNTKNNMLIKSIVSFNRIIVVYLLNLKF